MLQEAISLGKPSIKANFWGYYASRLPVVAFDFTVSRHRDGPDEVLSDFKGNLMGDCWSGFQKIDIRSDSRIRFAACWAHVRRKIDECRSAFPVQVAKLESLIRMLYEVEDQIKDLDDEKRLARRQGLSRHVLDLIGEYLGSDAMQSPMVLPKSNLGGAAGYLRRHWEALCRFTGDATIPIDNNDCEQLMKRVATGRKNWMFKGSVAAGERAANLMTIIGSAIRNDLDVRAYLDDVLRRALSGETDWSNLTPHPWRTEHPQSIRHYRQDERRQAADRKRTRRRLLNKSPRNRYWFWCTVTLNRLGYAKPNLLTWYSRMNNKQKTLIRKYKKFDSTIKKIVQVSAVAFKPMARTNLIPLASKAGVRHEDGRLPNYKDIRDELNAAIETGVLEYVSNSKTGPVAVDALIIDYVFRDAFDSGLAKSVMGQFGQELPHRSSYYRYHDQEPIVREMRMAFYQGEFITWSKLRDQIQAIPIVLSPFCGKAFERLTIEFQSVYFVDFSRDAVTLSHQADPEFYNHIDVFLDSLPEIPDEVAIAATDLFAARGDLGALRKLDNRVTRRSEVKGCIAFLTGEYNTAREHFENALKETRKRTKKRKLELKHVPSLFYALLLMKENSPQSHKQLRQVAKAIAAWDKRLLGDGCAVA